MIYARWIAKALNVALRLRHPGVRLTVLGPSHAAEAVELLSQEFCRREPLSRELGLRIEDIRPFFTQLVASVIEQQLGVVALSARGELLGVVTNEDYFTRMEPHGQLAEGLNAIGDYLDSIRMPQDLEPSERGQLFHSGLAAVRSDRPGSAILTLMILFTYRQAKSKGYSRGYAKVTNAAIARRFQALDRLARSRVFRCVREVKPAEFVRDGVRPFQNMRGSSYLFTWILP